MIAALCLLCLAGCGEKSSSGLSPVQTANVSTLEPGTIQIPSYDRPEITYAPMPTFEPAMIEVPEFERPEITFVPFTFEPATIEIPVWERPEITMVPIPDFQWNVTIEIPEIRHEPIEVKGFELSVPQVDYEVTTEKIGSAYMDTYTVPDIQVEVPQYEQQELNEVFVSVADNLSPEMQAQLAGLSDEEFARIAAVQLSLTDRLLQAYKAAGVNVAIDPMTGAIPIDAALLYETDQYELRPEGKEALRTVFMVYYYVICQPEFQGALDSIVIEGHTDTEGDHAYNQELSEKRAQAVRDYLLSDECGMPNREYLESLLKTVGRSYDDPVYAADGSVNMDASRRVEIRFALKLEPNS